MTLILRKSNSDSKQIASNFISAETSVKIKIDISRPIKWHFYKQQTLVRTKRRMIQTMLTRSKALSVECGICLSTCHDTLGRIQCCHNFCAQCIERWTKEKNSCPICRACISSIVKHPVDRQPFKNNLLQLLNPVTVQVRDTEYSDAPLTEQMVQMLETEYVYQDRNLIIPSIMHLNMQVQYQFNDDRMI